MCIRFLRPIAVLSGVVVWLAACAAFGPLAPSFKGSTTDEPTGLTQVKGPGDSLKLPPGWAPAPFKNPDANATQVFLKSGTSVTLTVFNWGIARRDQTAALAEERSPRNTHTVRGPYCLGSNIGAPCFKVKEGTVTSKGRDVPVTLFIGFNIDLLSGQHGLVMQGDPKDMQNLEGEFRAILRAM